MQHFLDLKHSPAYLLRLFQMPDCVLSFACDVLQFGDGSAEVAVLKDVANLFSGPWSVVQVTWNLGVVHPLQKLCGIKYSCKNWVVGLLKPSGLLTTFVE